MTAKDLVGDAELEFKSASGESVFVGPLFRDVTRTLYLPAGTYDVHDRLNENKSWKIKVESGVASHFELDLK